MGQLTLTTTEVEKVLSGRYHSPIHDVAGDNYSIGVPLVVSADTEYPFVSNGNTRNKKVLPAHITSIWDTATNIASFANFLNTPMIVANVSMVFDPNIAAEGKMTIGVYVNETVPILISETIVNYKATVQRLTGLLTFYAGEETGFDVKNKGVFFRVKSSAAGDLYDTAITIYRT